MLSRSYEILFLLKTEATQDDVLFIESNIEKILAAHNSKLALFDNWGKHLLSYPVNKNSYGVYAIARYTINADVIKTVNDEIESFIKIKCSDLVSRYTIVVLKDNTNLAHYLKPEMPEELENQGLDSDQEKKIENLLDSVDFSTEEDATQEEQDTTVQA